jgi:hypothetical protein
VVAIDGGGGDFRAEQFRRARADLRVEHGVETGGEGCEGLGGFRGRGRALVNFGEEGG